MFIWQTNFLYEWKRINKK